MKFSTLDVRERAVSAHKSKQSVTDIAKMYGVHRTTIHRWIARNKKEKTLQRKKNPGSGKRPKLTIEQTEKLTKLILKPATKYGYDTDFWTIRRIIEIAKEHLNIKIPKSTMHRILFNEKYSYKKPERRYYEANREEQENWIKNVIPKIKACVKKYRGILYFEDEASIALTAVLGKTWGPIGSKTIQTSTGNKASVSAISAISNNGQLIFTLHEKKISAIDIIHFLDQMLKHHPKRHIIVVMDRAPTHTAKMTQNYIESQKRLHVFYLPPRSPHLNPDEKVWNHLKNEEMKGHQARNKKELKMLTRKKLTHISKKPKLLRGIFMRCEIANFFAT